MNKNRFLSCLLVFLVVAVPVVYADIIVFDRYDTTMSYDSGVLTVTKNLRLKNVGDSPIIPGEVHFRLSKDVGGDSVAPEVSSFKVINKFNRELDTRLVTSDKELSLVFTVWDPLLPEFYYDMTMSYDMVFKPKGVLFYEISLPEERTTIPIKSAQTSFLLPKKFSITHAPDGDISSTDDARVVSWDRKGSFAVEYSVVPFPRLGLKASHVFWIIIIAAFLVNLVLRLRKKAMMAK